MATKHFYRSELSDRPCEHRHLTYEAAERCARRRIRSGETYVGRPMDAADAEQCVGEYHPDGVPVGG